MEMRGAGLKGRSNHTNYKDYRNHRRCKGRDLKASGKCFPVLLLCLSLLLGGCGGPGEVTPAGDGPAKEDPGFRAEETSAEVSSADPYSEPWYGSDGSASSAGGSAAHRGLARKNQVQTEGAARITNYYRGGKAKEKDWC